jgi:hypothetical protein
VFLTHPGPAASSGTGNNLSELPSAQGGGHGFKMVRRLVDSCVNILGSRWDGTRRFGNGTAVNKLPDTVQAELLVARFWNPFDIAKNDVDFGIHAQNMIVDHVWGEVCWQS